MADKEPKMASIHDVAAYILKQQGPMPAMKLQKLVYYSQAWSLARRDEPLFGEHIEAWAHGPVVYELYHLHRGSYVVPEWPWGDPSILRDEERAHIDSIIECYGSLSAVELSERTHREEPWKQARAGIPDGQAASVTISHESMRQYYRTLGAPAL